MPSEGFQSERPRTGQDVDSLPWREVSRQQVPRAPSEGWGSATDPPTPLQLSTDLRRHQDPRTPSTGRASREEPGKSLTFQATSRDRAHGVAGCGPWAVAGSWSLAAAGPRAGLVRQTLGRARGAELVPAAAEARATAPPGPGDAAVGRETLLAKEKTVSWQTPPAASGF